VYKDQKWIVARGPEGDDDVLLIVLIREQRTDLALAGSVNHGVVEMPDAERHAFLGCQQQAVVVIDHVNLNQPGLDVADELVEKVIGIDRRQRLHGVLAVLKFPCYREKRQTIHRHRLGRRRHPAIGEIAPGKGRAETQDVALNLARRPSALTWLTKA
jgi:hypothetical protein